ncbi:hypothetical protein [Brevundimonas vesicularis]|uniref:hypothetical protein n=1 Tax=Brevundimonas vesicularis TaxID=41276 RepID=UPI00289BDADF|nr:hypothetical protein [Brevundimonas vesicularis]
MTAYHVVLVRFDGSREAYPVNGHEGWSEGDRVLVEMNWETKKEFVVGEVVGLSFSKKPCRHSIVTSEENAGRFGGGPDAVTTEDDFIRYLTARGFTDVQATFDDVYGQPPTPWHAAYISNYDPERWATVDYVQSSSRVILMGDQSVSVHEPSQNGNLFLQHKSGVLWFTPYNRIETVSSGGEHVYRKAAQKLFGDYVYPVDDGRYDYIPFTYDGD